MPDLQHTGLPQMKPGFYRLRYDLTLRKNPGLGTSLANGKYHSQSHENAGNIVFVDKITYLSHSIWGNTTRGCICLYMNKKYFVDAI